VVRQGTDSGRLTKDGNWAARAQTRGSGRTQTNTPPHRIHHEHWIIRGIFIRLPRAPYGNLLLISEGTLRTIRGIRARSIPQ
jgi:hypothetical protein